MSAEFDPAESFRKVMNSNEIFAQMTGINPGLPEIEPPAEILNAALGLRVIFNSYVKVGFNEDQAMSMLLGIVKGFNL